MPILSSLGDRLQIFTDKPHGVFEGFLQRASDAKRYDTPS